MACWVLCRYLRMARNAPYGPIRCCEEQPALGGPPFASLGLQLVPPENEESCPVDHHERGQGDGKIGNEIIESTTQMDK